LVIGTSRSFTQGPSIFCELESALDKSLSLNRMIWRPLEYKTPEEVTRALLERVTSVSASAP
jgi:hypothetical protein